MTLYQRIYAGKMKGSLVYCRIPLNGHNGIYELSLYYESRSYQGMFDGITDASTMDSVGFHLRVNYHWIDGFDIIHFSAILSPQIVARWLRLETL
jgi:hypothetical protein